MHRTQEIIFDIFCILKNKSIDNYKIDYNYIDILSMYELFIKSDSNRIIKYDNFIENLDKLRLEEEIDESIICEYLSCLNKKIKITKHMFETICDISRSDIKSHIKKYFKEESGNYILYEIELNDSVVYKKIVEILMSKYGSTKQYYYIDKCKYELKENIFKEKISQKKNIYPIKLIHHSTLGSKISKIYAEELMEYYYNGNEIDFKYFNSSALNLFGENNIDKGIDTIKQLYLNEIINIDSNSIIKYNKNTQELCNISSPHIIITSSGMCDEGPVLDYLHKNLKNSDNTILLSGYQSNGTNGYLLQNLKNKNKEELSLAYIDTGKDNKFSCLDICAEIETIYGYSGHADQSSLASFIVRDEDNYKFSCKNVFLVHGDNNSRETLKTIINDRCELLNYNNNCDTYKTNVIIPKLKDGWFDIIAGKFVEDDKFETKSDINIELIDSINELKSCIVNLTKEISKLNSTKIKSNYPKKNLSIAKLIDFGE